MTDNYGMQPAQPQYGADASNGYVAAQPNQYGAPPQQQYMQQQPNPYAAPTTTAAAGGDNEFEEDADKEIYKENEEWVFTPKWDHSDDLQLKTACCCCNCAFDDCQDVMQIQSESVLLCMAQAITWKLFQCQDQSQRACCLNTQKVAFCDFTSEDEEVFCSFAFCGVRGIFCLCCSGQAYQSYCDPCMMPETCCKQLCQMFCIHLRCALPCDEELVPFEIGCCGFMCKESEA